MPNCASLVCGGAVTTVNTAGDRAERAMMAGIVTDQAANERALDASARKRRFAGRHEAQGQGKKHGGLFHGDFLFQRRANRRSETFVPLGGSEQKAGDIVSRNSGEAPMIRPSFTDPASR